MKTLLIGILVALVILTAIVLGRKKRMGEADTVKKAQLDLKESWSREEIMSASQVETLRRELLDDLKSKLQDEPGHLAELEKIINDWADLKLKTFQERRSWIRKPG